MQENQLIKSFYLLAGVIGVLLMLSLIPEFESGDIRFRNIDLLADVHPDTAAVAIIDTVKSAPKPAEPVNPCPPGITCIDDFSAEENALSKFFRALNESSRRPVRIAFFGDSFIEGDILCAAFRDTLQQVYGGTGVGFVPITSQVISFRTTIKHAFSGWKTYWAVGDKSPFAPLGLSGYCFVPEAANEVEYKPGTYRYSKFHEMRLFYVSHSPDTLVYTENDSILVRKPLTVSDTLQRTTLPCEGAQSIKLHFQPPDSLKVYGVSFEHGPGVYVDNFAMRGNSGMGLLQVGSTEISQFNAFQNYRLIILQYGLNVVSETDTTDYRWYGDKMVKVVQRLRQHFPESSILMIGVSDRSYNKNGKFITMPNILKMRSAQREAARRCKIAYWDLFDAMGGENSMPKFVTAVPPLAGKDYTHVTAAGGRKLAKKLADAILYQRRKNVSQKKILH